LDDVPGKSDGVDEVFENAITRMTRRRAVIDSLFQGLLHPGNRLELFDGLHPQEAVEAAITPDFAGTLDLTTCTSMPLADHISAARRFVPRVVHFDEPQQPEWAAGCLKLTMELIGIGRDYLKARAEAVEIMRMAVRELASSQR
jgi:hypothetical protein